MFLVSCFLFPVSCFLFLLLMMLLMFVHRVYDQFAVTFVSEKHAALFSTQLADFIPPFRCCV